MEKITPKVPPQAEKKEKNSEPKVDKRTREYKQGKVSEDITPKSDEIVSEELNDDNNSDGTEFESHEEFVKHLKPEQHKEGEEFVKSSETIDLGAKNSGVEEDSNVKVDFMNNNFMNDFISKESERSEEKESEDGKGEEKVDSKGDSKIPDSSDGSSFTKDDFGDFAEVFMDILDMGISTALRFWAKDTSTTEYEVPVDKKRRLVRQLTNLFMKYQTKFSLEFMFVVTLLICYAVPVQKANKRRKLLKSGVNPEEIKRGPGKPKK